MATYKRSKSGGSPHEGQSNSASPASSVALSNAGSAQGINNNAPKYGTLVPNRIFVGGITSNTTETELTQLFSKYGNVKATKIIADRAGVSKGYGFVTFESEDEVKYLFQESNNIVLKERRLNIAPAIKKQPFSRPIDAPSPPPTSPNLYFHNGMPYTFHNGMAFFSPTLHQPAIAAMPPSADPAVYPAYGTAQGASNAPYGAPVLVPAPTPMFMPQNYSYQPMPIPNGGPASFLYANSGSPISSPGSPMGAGPDSPHAQSQPPHLQPHVAAHFYAPHQFAPPDSYYPPPVYIGYYPSEYDSVDQRTINDECSSVASTSCSDVSEQSGRSSATPQTRVNQSRPPTSTEASAPLTQPSPKEPPRPHSHSDGQVPVVSWQTLKMHGEERELLIRDGRRAFHPIVRPPRHTPQQVLVYRPQFPSPQPHPAGYPSERPIGRGRVPVTPMSFVPRMAVPNHVGDRSRGPRARSNNSDVPPFIPKFPDSFNNNNNPHTMNREVKKTHERIYPHDAKSDLANGKPPRYNKPRDRNSQNVSPSDSIHKSSPSGSYPVSSSPQMMQQAMERAAPNPPAPRWGASNPPPQPPPPQPQIKRIASNAKRHNGVLPSTCGTNNQGVVCVGKKGEEAGAMVVVGDLGGGGDAPSAGASEVLNKLQSLTFENSS